MLNMARFCIGVKAAVRPPRFNITWILQLGYSELILDFCSNFYVVGFQCKVPGIKEMNFCIFDVTLIGFNSRWNKERVVLTPYS
ncbi:hypothetical protein MNBD_ALPHA02-1119 [hydrothermal vent metagenome]|uniref:Uncharacterized protein n=1 Tax=hydrothermal vent metagenome TaxID=652676 RepID=A0A3B0RI09_9ZZZZ